MTLLSAVGGLSFGTPFRVRPVGRDADVEGAATSVFRLRAGQEGVFARIDGQHAFMIASDSSRWRWPAAGQATSVMLFTTVADRRVVRELRRLGDPQRRDALFKAELRAAGAR